MSETPETNERRHSEAPAEGEDTDAAEASSAERVHAEEPAEGSAADDAAGPGAP
jgi:hypothetical protein